jgi:phospholipid-binding lipoprotein MlaA
MPTTTRAIAIAAMLALSACAGPSPQQKASGEPFDPYEKTNRAMHSFNLAVDQTLFGPASKGYSSIVPEPIMDSVGHVADNLSMPSSVVNSLLQGNLEQAGIGLLRFVLNSTVGIAGLADPSTDFGIPQAETDFGETLAVWGVGEGAYLVLPFVGPSTARDSVGVLADIFTNPITFSPTRPLQNSGVIANILSSMGSRGRYSDTVDSVLYDSADSYAQTRMIFLQNRRFELGQEDAAAEIDPFDLDTEGF